LKKELIMRGVSLLKYRLRVRPKFEHRLFDRLHSCVVVSDEVADRKAKYTQSSGTLSIKTVLGCNNRFLSSKPKSSLNYLHLCQKVCSEEN
jgi:hypothetical protein